MTDAYQEFASSRFVFLDISNVWGFMMETMTPNPDFSIVRDQKSLASESTSHSGLGATPSAQQIIILQHRELWSKTVTLSRGRAPGDPHARSVNFHCQNMEELMACLHNHLANFCPEYPPEHTTVDLIFPLGAAFLVADPIAAAQHGPKLTQAAQALLSLDRIPSSTFLSVMEAMTPMPDPKDNMKKQRAIAKACVEAVQRADGNRYSFHNSWWSKEDEANRFSYFCNDSILNKGRSANGGAGTIGQRVRKPVYDCKGIITVKFSAVKQNLQVQYKHVPIHKSYEERAPRPRRGTTRYRLAELYNPGSLARRRKTKPVKAADSSRRKRKKQTSDEPSPDEADDDLTPESMQSLLGLTTPEVVRLTAAPSSSYGAWEMNKKKPKCAMCKSKKAKCDGKTPCSTCAERPLFCTYPKETNEKEPSSEGGTQAQAFIGQLEPRPPPTATATDPMPSKKLKVASTGQIHNRDVRKELGEAMSEFDTLKAKLLEAEERVKRLEAEKENRSAAQRNKRRTKYARSTRTDRPGL